jgi:malonyl CoA-acyl carrier protein transacylase
MIRDESITNLAELYQSDEVAWLEQMAALAAEGDTASLDLAHLGEYLLEMARREKREVVSRLVTLLVHLLKWEHQPDHRSRSWDLTIQEQREELQELLESGALRNHAQQELAQAYRKAVRRAAVETEKAEKDFPEECPYHWDQIL